MCSGYRNHDKKKTHKYDSSKSRMRKKAGGREKEGAGGLRRGGSRASSQRPSRSHSDDEEDEGVPASYHTVSLQVSQDVSTTALFTLLPFVDLSPATLKESCFTHKCSLFTVSTVPAVAEYTMLKEKGTVASKCLLETMAFSPWGAFRTGVTTFLMTVMKMLHNEAFPTAVLLNKVACVKPVSVGAKHFTPLDYFPLVWCYWCGVSLCGDLKDDACVFWS